MVASPPAWFKRNTTETFQAFSLSASFAPTFDYQGTGRPGNVQCTEGVYQAVVNDPKCHITWEKPHVVFAKGFGNISAYFMRSSEDPPPKELMATLALDFNTETYYFAGNAPTANSRRLANEPAISYDEDNNSAGGRGQSRGSEGISSAAPLLSSANANN